MSTLYIAEKPSLGQAIATALPGTQRKRDGFIETSNGDVVTWCVGHLLEQVEPHVYNPNHKRWSLADLPIVPVQWKLSARKKTKKQLTVIKRLIKSATRIVHAGDPDREGQLIVDEVLGYCGLSKTSQDNVGRLLVSDMNLSAVKKALTQIKQNKELRPLSDSALARSHADWLYGINMTRAMTLRAQQKNGYQKGVLSIGRVQTPVLGIVVRRDNEIKNFVPKPFYAVVALIPHKNQIIEATWKPSDACKAYQDKEGRLIEKHIASTIAARIKKQDAFVVAAEHKKTEQAPPLPFSLSALQIKAAELYGLSAKAVLKASQTLYEKHKAITYPRSDSSYLPEGHYQDSKSVVGAIIKSAPELKPLLSQLDSSRRSKAWNDKKVGAHHAIIPTATPVAVGTLGSNESKVYELVARRYLMQFARPAVYATAMLKFKICTGKFIANGKTLLEGGWQTLKPPGKTKSKKKELAPPYLPALSPGEMLTCSEGKVLTKKTQCPKHFNDKTIMEAMTGIARFVENKELKKILKETDGLGTNATRANIIELLFRRKFLIRKGKKILATEIGKKLIESLPKEATLPDMTAHWERRLKAIANENDAYGPFMASLTAKIEKMI